MTNQIRFDDGAAYERYMGQWSQIAGATFLEWLSPAPRLRWLDVGCGNGAFTEMVVQRCAPASVDGIDPSEAQLTYARTRHALQVAQFQKGDAMALPFRNDTFDVAVMPLVIFFVPDPAKGVAEMARVVCAGGLVTAYAWDMDGGGFPYELLKVEMRGLGADVPEPPSPDASSMDILKALWTSAGFREIETHAFAVHRSFDDFDDYWATVCGGPSVGAQLRAMAPDTQARLRARLRATLPADSTGRITCSARVNAVRGRVANSVVTAVKARG